jgi:hypothetical protein
MRRLDLDFAASVPRWPARALLLAGVLAALDAGARLHEHQREQVRQQALAEQSLQTALTPPPIDQATQLEWQAARQASADLALPWEPLFLAIEGALGPDVALLSVDPDPGRQSLRLGGEARDFPALLAFVSRLESGGVLRGVHLLSHEIRGDVAQRPYRFVLAARWERGP